MIDDPSDDEIEALLRAERSRAPEAPETIAAIRRGATARLAALGWVEPGASSTSPAGSVGASHLASPAASPVVSWLVRLGLFAAGATSGWMAHEVVDAHQDERARVPHVAPAAHESHESEAVDASVPEQEISPAAPTPQPPLDDTRGPASPRSPETTTPRALAPLPNIDESDSSNLARERRLIEAAQSDLVRGELASALARLREHARVFPSGRLAEEREALFVRSLVRAGRLEEAREHADAFRLRFPRSLLRPMVDRTLPPREIESAPASTPEGPE